MQSNERGASKIANCKAGVTTNNVAANLSTIYISVGQYVEEGIEKAKVNQNEPK